MNIYLPTMKTLPKLYDATVGGSVILVDGVHTDGAVYDSIKAMAW